MANTFFHVEGDGLIPPPGFDDQPILTDGDDLLDAGNGRDIAFAGGGNDRLLLGNAPDQGFGQDGDDVIFGQRGRDLLDGGLGRDRLFGGKSADEISGGLGRDRLRGGAQDDVIDGGASVDLLAGGAGFDTLTGGLGRDRFVFRENEGADTVTDFTVDRDLLVLRPITQGDPAKIALVGITEVGANVEISYDGALVATLLDAAGDGVSTSDMLL